EQQASQLTICYEKAQRSLSYPVAPPSQPAPPSKPEQLAHIQVDVGTLDLQLPYYVGRRAFLNRLVERAHSRVMEEFRHAQEAKAALEQWLARINQRIAMGNAAASERWERGARRSSEDYQSVLKQWQDEKRTYERLTNAEWNRLTDIRAAYESK